VFAPTFPLHGTVPVTSKHSFIEVGTTY